MRRSLTRGGVEGVFGSGTDRKADRGGTTGVVMVVDSELMVVDCRCESDRVRDRENRLMEKLGDIFGGRGRRCNQSIKGC